MNFKTSDRENFEFSLPNNHIPHHAFSFHSNHACLDHKQTPKFIVKNHKFFHAFHSKPLKTSPLSKRIYPQNESISNKNFDKLFKMTKRITNIKINHCKGSHSPNALSTIHKMKSLKHLTLDNSNKMSSKSSRSYHVRKLQHLKNIESLNLCFEIWPDSRRFPLSVFKNMTNLSLRLKTLKFNAEILQKLRFKTLTNLAEFSLFSQSNFYAQDGLDYLSGCIEKMKNLHKIETKLDFFGHFNQAYIPLSYVNNCAKLESLSLNSPFSFFLTHPLDDKGYKSLFNLKSLFLNFKFQIIPKPIFTKLTHLFNSARNLTSLQLSFQSFEGMDDTNFSNLAQSLSNLPKLGSIGLEISLAPKLSDKGILILAQEIKGLNSIKKFSLEVTGSTLTSSSLTELLKSFSSLASLKLHLIHCKKLESEFLETFFQSLNSSNLKVLDLNFMFCDYVSIEKLYADQAFISRLCKLEEIRLDFRETWKNVSNFDNIAQILRVCLQLKAFNLSLSNACLGENAFLELKSGLARLKTLEKLGLKLQNLNGLQNFELSELLGSLRSNRILKELSVFLEDIYFFEIDLNGLLKLVSNIRGLQTLDLALFVKNSYERGCLEDWREKLKNLRSLKNFKFLGFAFEGLSEMMVENN